jgi:phosphoadenosine phosphosulfate reductase
VRISRVDLDGINARFRDAKPIELLRFAHATFGPRAAILSSMQRAGTALCFLADQAGLAFDVLFVDTGVLHEQTRWTRDELERTHKHLRVKTLSPEKSFARQTEEEGLLYLSREGQERCCDLRKTAPLNALRGHYDALIGALRKGEGGARGGVEPFGLDPAMNALRIHPFASLPESELAALLEKEPGIVVNPLHKMGFPTIGCFPCTTPVRPDEPERAGRWRHLAGVEYCGINPVDRGTAGEVELDDRYAGPLALSLRA